LAKNKFTSVFIAFVLMMGFLRLREFFSRGRDKTSLFRIKWAFYLVFIGYLISVLIIIFEYFLSQSRINLLISVTGLAIFGLGFVLKNNSISSLGKNWSFFTEIKINQDIITTGTYRYIRHPYYLSVILELVGFSIFANAYIGLLFIIFFQIPLLILRIYQEEAILIKNFGQKYICYKNKIAMFVPFIKPFKNLF